MRLLFVGDVMGHGWRSAALVVAGLALLVSVLVTLLLPDRPSDRGLLPYGAAADAPAPAAAPPTARAAVAHAVTVLRESCRTRPFLLLAGTFFVCGWTTNGIISSHFVPAAHDHGMAATTAAGRNELRMSGPRESGGGEGPARVAGPAAGCAGPTATRTC